MVISNVSPLIKIVSGPFTESQGRTVTKQQWQGKAAF